MPADTFPPDDNAISGESAISDDNAISGESATSGENVIIDENTLPSENVISEGEIPTPPAAPPPTVSLSFGQTLRSALLPVAAFLLVGLLWGLRVTAQATLPHIFQPGDYVNFQGVVDGLPVPRPLAWNVEAMDLLATLRDLSGMSLLLAILFVFGPLWLIILRRVNPTFRLVSHAPAASFSAPNSAAPNSNETPASGSPVPAALSTQTPNTEHRTPNTGVSRITASSALSTPLEFYGLVKALSVLAITGVPIAAAWILLDWDDLGGSLAGGSLAANNPPLIGSVWALRLALIGIAFWIGFHRDGLAGDFTRPEWNPTRSKLPFLALRGACFGLLAFAVCRIALPQHIEDALLRLQTLGDFNRAAWNRIAAHVLLGFALAWLAIGSIFVFLSPPPHVRAHRALLCLPLLACIVAGIYQRRLAPQVLAARYDMRPAVLQAIPENGSYRPNVPASGVPDGTAAAMEMARQLHLPLGTRTDDPNTALSGRTLALFAPPRSLMRLLSSVSGVPPPSDPSQPLFVYQNNMTLDGLAPDAASAGRITSFLEQRGYESALSWMALRTLFNFPLLRFDTTGAIRASLQDLTHYPHNAQFAITLEQMFAICAATPENLALLDQWADETHFAFPDRESRRLMGDLYRRFGSIEKALTWYRKADMPSSFLDRIRRETPVLRTGYIQGVLRWNGRPLVGAQVAVVPSLMDGLPSGMEMPVSQAFAGMANIPPRANPGLFPAYHPYPWQFRWISATATTDSRGAYRIDHLIQGTYNALCTLPPDVKPTLPFDNRLQIIHPIPRFNLYSEQTFFDAGTTEFKW